MFVCVEVSEVLEVLEVAARYAARGGPLRGYGGPLRGSRRAAMRLWRAGRYAAQVYHTRPKLFYEAQHQLFSPVVLHQLFLTSCFFTSCFFTSTRANVRSPFTQLEL